MHQQRILPLVRLELERIRGSENLFNAAVFDDSRHYFSSGGKSIEFGRKRLLYAIWQALWESGESGVTEVDLVDAVWGNEAVSSETVRKAVVRLRRFLVSSGADFFISSKNSRYFFRWKNSFFRNSKS